MSEPMFLSRDKHPISRKDIDKGVLHILYTLKDSRFRATLVGGCIRDMLCGLKPKDFDIATDAPPEKIRRLFRRCYIIGRRFRLAHVYTSKNDFVEVATYRGPVDQDAKENQMHPQANNTYGSISEDALRRDFTINALYYDINGFSIIDYVGGLDDIKNKIVRMIGDPYQRILEDPVRIIRAVKYAAKLDFNIEPVLLTQCQNLIPELIKTNTVRRLEELYKILNSGYSAPVFKLLHKIDAINAIAPQCDKNIDLLITRLRLLDESIANGNKFSRGVLIGLLYYQRILGALHTKQAQLGKRIDATSFYYDEFTPIAISISLPKVDREIMRSVLMQQDIFKNPYERSFNKKRFVQSRNFKDAFDLFKILNNADENSEIFEFWYDLIDKIPPLPDKPKTKKKANRYKRKRRKPPVK